MDALPTIPLYDEGAGRDGSSARSSIELLPIDVEFTSITAFERGYYA